MPGGGGYDVEAAFGLVLFIREPQECLPAIEEPRKDLREVLVDARKCFVEFLARNLVDLLDRLLRVLDGIDEILALRFEEGVPVSGFLVLFECHHVDRSHLLDLLAQSAAGFFFRNERLVYDANDCLIGAQRGGLFVYFGQRAALQVFEVRAQLGNCTLLAGPAVAKQFQRGHDRS